MESTETNFLNIYLAILNSLAYSYRLAIEQFLQSPTFTENSNNILYIEYCGYYSDNHTFLQILADVLEMTVWTGLSQRKHYYSQFYEEPEMKILNYTVMIFKKLYEIEFLINYCFRILYYSRQYLHYFSIQ